MCTCMCVVCVCVCVCVREREREGELFNGIFNGAVEGVELKLQVLCKHIT